MAININLNRTGLVNKRSEVGPYINKEHLNFESIGGQSRAILKESIWKEGDTFTTVKVYHGDTPLTEGTDYTVQNEAATITLLSTPEDNRYYASYYPGGSIIWAEDVNELQTAVQTIATDALDKTGDTMSGTLNMNNNMIAYASTYNGVKIETHNHSNGQGGLILSSGIEDGAITTSKIASQAVETNKIKDLAVTNEKIESVDVGKVDGLLNQVANRYLTNLYSGLENVVCTENPTTIATATIQRPSVVIDTRRDASGNWRRLYSDGWVEMGGIPSINSGGYVDIVLSPIVMLDTNYTIVAPGTTISNKTVNGFRMTNNSLSGICNWEIRGVASGTQSTVLFEQYNITNGSNVVNTLFTNTLTSNTNLEIVLAGACGYSKSENTIFNGGGIIRCTKMFSSGQTLQVKSINSAHNYIYAGYSTGIGMLMLCDNNIILSAGGGGVSSYEPTRDTGGSGYAGGAVVTTGESSSRPTTNGYSNDGSLGNFTGTGTANGGIGRLEGFVNLYVYGGNGYIHSDYTSSTTATSGSETTGNFGNAYVKIIAY